MYPTKTAASMKTMQKRVLIVEDEDDLRDTLCRYLQHAGLDAVGFGDAESVPTDVSDFDVAVCDINLPGQNGFSLVARLHMQSGIGLIVLTARDGAEDCLMGLALGVDQYLVKPVDLHELELRIRNLAERVHAPTAPVEPDAIVDAWTFRQTSWELVAPGSNAAVALTSTEYHLVDRLATAPGETVTRELLLAAIGRANLDDYSRNLDVTVSRLRRKVRNACGEALPITAARGVGYAFAAAIRRT